MVAMGPPMEKKSMESWTSQGDGGVRKEQMGRAKWVQGLKGFK